MWFCHRRRWWESENVLRYCHRGLRRHKLPLDCDFPLGSSAKKSSTARNSDFRASIASNYLHNVSENAPKTNEREHVCKLDKTSCILCYWASAAVIRFGRFRADFGSLSVWSLSVPAWNLFHTFFHGRPSFSYVDFYLDCIFPPLLAFLVFSSLPYCLVFGSAWHRALVERWCCTKLTK